MFYVVSRNWYHIKHCKLVVIFAFIMLFFSILTSFSYFQNRYCSSTLFYFKCRTEGDREATQTQVYEKTVFQFLGGAHLLARLFQCKCLWFRKWRLPFRRDFRRRLNRGTFIRQLQRQFGEGRYTRHHQPRRENVQRDGHRQHGFPKLSIFHIGYLYPRNRNRSEEHTSELQSR